MLHCAPTETAPFRCIACIACVWLACGGPAQVSPERQASGPPPAADTSASQAVAAQPQTPRIPLMVFPHETDLLLSVDVARVTASPLYEGVLDDWVQREWGERLNRLRELCSLSLLSTVGQVLSAHSFDDEANHRDEMHMMSVRGLARTAVRQCVRILVDKKLATGFAEDGPYTKVETKDGPKWYVWLDETTVVLPSDMDREQLQTRMTAADNLHNNIAMAELANLVERDAPVWGILRLPPGKVDSSGIEFESVYGWMHLDRGIALRVGFRHPDGDSARRTTAEMAKMLDQMVSQAGDLGRFLDGFEVGTQDADMIITLTMDQAALQDFLRDVAPILRNLLPP